MSRTDVKTKEHTVKQRKGEWDKAISVVDERLAMAVERVENLKGIRERLLALKDAGEPWPSATQN